MTSLAGKPTMKTLWYYIFYALLSICANQEYLLLAAAHENIHNIQVTLRRDLAFKYLKLSKWLGSRDCNVGLLVSWSSVLVQNELFQQFGIEWITCVSVQAFVVSIA